MKAAIKRNFSILIVMIFVAAVAVFYCVIGENSYIAVHDNLDLFVAQFAMLRNTGTFFAHNVAAPFLGGVSRDVLPGEFSLYTILYVIFPPFTAYVVGYIAKVLIAVVSMRLLVKDIISVRSDRKNILGDNTDDNDKSKLGMATLVGLLYGVLNMFPAFGIAFSSIPILILLLRKMYRSAGTLKSPGYLLFVFSYPILSYFSYFGIFILGYLFIAIIWMWIKDRRMPRGLVISLVALVLGYIVNEYRLFDMMLFSKATTIRETMDPGFISGKEILHTIADVFVNGIMHAEPPKILMPLCAVYFVYLNASYILKKNAKGIFSDIYNLGALVLVFNAVVYGLYFYEPVNKLISTILPPLKGFQFNRTVFFSPLVWCLMFCVILYRIKAPELIKYFVVLAVIGVVLLTPGRYNDLYNTALNTARTVVFGNENDTLNYREFYSTDLFESIKEDLDYMDGEWSVAYGMHPAILEYNGICTLDGYLGFYPQSYKEKFRKVIEPALLRKENTRSYYDDWGARCYLYSGTDDSIVMATKSMAGVTDETLYANTDALRGLGCKYIFSRINISNTEELGLNMVGIYDGYGSPYTIYVYSLR
ncbi:MAG: hypothetical protein IKZ97_07230 [Butyrivibrio sp.]|nr:hypothetical protein [Butyrivibrio sp.]